jgi:hypothetical protein
VGKLFYYPFYNFPFLVILLNNILLFKKICSNHFSYIYSKLTIVSKEEKSDLLKFLSPFSEDIQERAMWLREFVWDLYPQTNELIYDNYNAVAFGWSPTEKPGHTFCSIAVGRSSGNVHFGFYWGAELSDPEKILLGNGNQYRYVLVKNRTEFPKEYIIQLLGDAYANSIRKIKDPKQIVTGKTITKSISAIQRVKRSK